MTRPSARRPLLPEPVTRYFDELGRVEAGPDLMENVVAEIESQRQPSRFQGLWPVAVMASAAVLVLAVMAFVGPRLSQPPTFGTTPRETPSMEPRQEPVSEGQLARLTDPRGDIEVGTDGDGHVPDLRTVTIASSGGELVLDLSFAREWGDPNAWIWIVMADPDTVPPNGPAPGSCQALLQRLRGPLSHRLPSKAPPGSITATGRLTDRRPSARCSRRSTADTSALRSTGIGYQYRRPRQWAAKAFVLHLRRSRPGERRGYRLLPCWDRVQPLVPNGRFGALTSHKVSARRCSVAA